MKRRILIVGPSGSGKTTVGETVARILGVPLFSMDDFRTRSHHPLYITVDGCKVRTFESPSLWDGHAVACKLRACIRLDCGFVAEGHHLLWYPDILAIPDTERYYLDVPFAVSIARRRTGHKFLEADKSFTEIGKIEMAKYVWPQKELPGIVLLDGRLPPATSVAAILQPVPV